MPDLSERRAAMAGATGERHERELVAAVRDLELGERATRLLWAIHRLVLGARSSVIAAPDVELAASVWGTDRARWPQNWRNVLVALGKSLTWVHVFDASTAHSPVLGTGSALLHDVEDLRGSAEDVCGSHCNCSERHHHIRMNVGRGFLGVLEQFALPDDGSGVRKYIFPISGGKQGRPTLKRVGKTGRLVTVFVPGELADSTTQVPLTPARRRLLRALVRELTRANKKAPAPGEFEPVVGALVPDAAGRRGVLCPQLNPASRYAAFGGNGVRRGQGYRLDSDCGWLTKAGYGRGDTAGFLADLAALAGPLGLACAGLDPSTGAWRDLHSLQTLSAHAPGRRVLDRVHLRVYGPADFVENWTTLFGWRSPVSHPPCAADPAAAVVEALTHAGVSRREVATGIGLDPSLFVKLLNGKKPWPREPDWAARALEWIRRRGPSIVVAPPLRASAVSPVTTAGRCIDAARGYRARGWAVVPIAPATKRPLVRWKEFQTRLPDEAELADWFERWPDAGLALVLGPVSNAFAIDVDGPEAHAALVGRLGVEPVAPRTISGSRQPSRYHLLFADPGVPTKAKATPWHPKLEFRGRGGLVILPPSVHPSGHRYEWAPGRSPADVPLAAVPGAVRDELGRPTGVTRRGRENGPSARVAGAFSPSTARFLTGEYRNGPMWNDRLFDAACDLAGRGHPVEEAEPLLLDGAAPWNDEEAESARRTVRSAFSRPRTPARR